MKRSKWLYNSVRLIVIMQFLLSLIFPVGALAASATAEPVQADSLVKQPGTTTGSSPLAPAAAILQVTVLSAPLLVVDSNGGAVQPRVYVVEAKVTNIGDTAATGVVLTLNYNNPGGWNMLSGEDASRQVGTLLPGEANSYYGYWFATYPATPGSTYTYSVTATGTNTGAPETTNFTASTISVISAANSGITQVAFNVVVGVEFTVDINYKLSNNAQVAHFSPVGNLDFNPAAYRLLSSTIYFYDAADAVVGTFTNRVYIGTNEIPSTAIKAKATFVFIALQAENTKLCSYAMVGYNAGYKYDINYCDPTAGGVININGTISLDFKKVANKLTVEQNQYIGYTLYYTNTGTAPLKYVWLWDKYNPALVMADPTSINPAAHSPETIDGQVAWYLGDVPVGGKGSVTFNALVDGNNTDISDQTAIVNKGHFGVTPGELPATPALTSTVTTVVQASTLTFTKSDGLTSITAGGNGTYTLTIANTGHASATVATVVDTLPSFVTPGVTSPAYDTKVGQVLTWNNVGPIAAGGSKTVTIPYTVNIKTPNGTVLNNQSTLTYQNSAGHIFSQMTASDNTTVNNAVMTITKTDSPDPVLANHTLLYTLTYANTGLAAATGVIISDTLPVGVTFKSCTGSCDYLSGVATWTIGTVGAGGGGSVTMTVDVGDLPKNTVITNGTYGLTSDQTGKVTGPAATTLVQRAAAFFNVRAYEDVNGNGKYDAVGDVLIPNVQIGLTEATTPTQFTKSTGPIQFRVETSGLVTITAGDMADYIHSTPTFLQTNAVLETTTNVDFGYISKNANFAILFGTVWNDANHNTAIDNGELGLPGVTITSPTAVTPTVTTDAFGWYTLKYTNPADATISETNPTGYVSTTPDILTNIHITIPSNNSSPYDFGDFAGVKITGKVFDDANASGTDEGENGLAGVTVSAGGLSAQTGASGVYTFYLTTAPLTPITISETDLPNYVSTAANPGTGVTKVDLNTLQVTAPVAGTTYSGNDFGDVLLSGVVTVTGLVWDDNGSGGGSLANGIKDGTEPGLAGATLTLSSGLSTISASDGSFTLYAPADSEVTLTETNPLGYFSTNAVPGSADATKVDNDTLTIKALPANTTTSGHMFGDVQSAPLAEVTGFVFNDANENGAKDGGEIGIAGVDVTLHFKSGQLITIPTDANGAYSFIVPLNQDMMLSSAGPGGAFYPTTPEQVGFKAISAGVYPNNNFGYSEDVNTAVIAGLVFDDRNSNGQLDFGEFGLAGVQVTLDGTTSVTTSSNGLIAGTFSFTVPAATNTPVTHHLTETSHLNGYRSTTPDTLNISVVPGTYSYYAEFGDTNNPDVGSIYGIVFDDANQNGIFENGELGLPGVTVSVTVGTGVITAVTKNYGQFSYGFLVAESGYHTVSSEDPALPGYHSTTPDNVNVLVELGKSYAVNFGDSNVNNAMILGTVFNDENGDGNQDPAELGIPGVVVNLTGGQTATTNNYGWYGFVVQNNGLYTVTEVDKAGYYSTTSNEVPVNVTVAKNYQVDFGDSNNNAATVFFGTVFNDINVNGLRDANEPALPGVTVTMSNTILVTRQTNEWGQYTFRIDEPGSYTIQETDLAGFVSTNAIPGSAAVTKVDNNNFSVAVTSANYGHPFGDNLFGDARLSDIVSISGMVWEDLDGDGSKDVNEPGLAGAVVTLSSGLLQTTGADGLYLLYGPANTILQVTETNPATYISTNAIPGSGNTKINRDRIQVSARAAGSSSTGNDFGDTHLTDAGVITGYVYNDANGNGVFDGGESGLAGVTLTLNGTTNTTSAADGSYQFVVTIPGVYSLVETDPAGFFSTTPNEVHINVVIGNSYVQDFGDAPTGSGFAIIYGVVFNDLNTNTVWDNNEPGLGNVTVSRDGGAATKTTNAFGLYMFNVTAGTHQVQETDPTGYQSSTPNLVNTTTTNGTAVEVDFGDFQSCVPVVDTFEQDDTVEEAKAITGFGVADDHNFADDSTDWVKFNGLAMGKYTITVDASFGNRADTVVEVYASDKVTRLVVNDDAQGKTDFSSKVEFLAPATGTYYVKVSNRSELTGCLTSYKITIDVVPPKMLYLPLIMKGGTQADVQVEGLLPAAPVNASDLQSINAPESPSGLINHICPDDFEVDDTWEQARQLTLAPVILPQLHSFDSNTALYAADKDHIKFTAAQFEKVSITLAPVENTQVKIELYDAERNLLKEGTTTLNYTFLQDGEYYLITSPTSANTAFGCTDVAGYTLNITYTPATFLYLPLISR